jgi:hypothetical protein
MSRAFGEEQLRTLETGAPEEVERLCAELRRLYAAEDAQQAKTESLVALLGATHQQLQSTGRTLESALRLMVPPQSRQATTQQGDGRKRPRMLMDEQPEPEH